MPRPRKNSQNNHSNYIVSIEQLEENIMSEYYPVELHLECFHANKKMDYLLHRMKGKGIEYKDIEKVRGGITTHTYEINIKLDGSWEDYIVKLLMLCYIKGLDITKEVVDFVVFMIRPQKNSKSNRNVNFNLKYEADDEYIEVPSLSPYRKLYAKLEKDAFSQKEYIQKIASWLNGNLKNSYVQLEQEVNTDTPIEKNGNSLLIPLLKSKTLVYKKSQTATPTDIEIEELTQIIENYDKQSLEKGTNDAEDEMREIDEYFNSPTSENYFKEIKDGKSNEAENKLNEIKLCENESFWIKEFLAVKRELKKKGQTISNEYIALRKKVGELYHVERDDMVELSIEKFFYKEKCCWEEAPTKEEYEAMGYGKLYRLFSYYNKGVGVFTFVNELWCYSHHIYRVDKKDILNIEEVIKKVNTDKEMINHYFYIAFRINKETVNDLITLYPALKDEIMDELNKPKGRIVIAEAEYCGKFY